MLRWNFVILNAGVSQISRNMTPINPNTSIQNSVMDLYFGGIHLHLMQREAVMEALQRLVQAEKYTGAGGRLALPQLKWVNHVGGQRN